MGDPQAGRDGSARSLLDPVDGRVSIDGMITLCQGSAMMLGPTLAVDAAINGGPEMPKPLLDQFLLGFQKAHEGIIAVLELMKREHGG